MFSATVAELAVEDDGQEQSEGRDHIETLAFAILGFLRVIHPIISKDASSSFLSTFRLLGSRRSRIRATANVTVDIIRQLDEHMNILDISISSAAPSTISQVSQHLAHVNKCVKEAEH